MKPTKTKKVNKVAVELDEVIKGFFVSGRKPSSMEIALIMELIDSTKSTPKPKSKAYKKTCKVCGYVTLSTKTIKFCNLCNTKI